MTKKRTICILGGTGFIGRHLANRLTADGHDLKVLTRYREGHRELLVLPTLNLVDADVHDLDVLLKAFQGCDTVINLVGIVNERGHDGSGFHHVHTELSRKVARAAREARVERVLHMSALGTTTANAPSHYLRSKGDGERALQVESGGHIPWTIFCPSVVFGPGDHFINRFAGLLERLPVLPLAAAGARFAPVSVFDVAEAFARALNDRTAYFRRYQLCGPEVYTLKQIVNYTAEVMDKKRLIAGLPDPLARLQANIMEYIPGKPFSRDNYRTTRIDNVCKADGKNSFGLKDLGIEPTPMEAIVPGYLGGRRYRARFAQLRREYRPG